MTRLLHRPAARTSARVLPFPAPPAPALGARQVYRVVRHDGVAYTATIAGAPRVTLVIHAGECPDAASLAAALAEEIDERAAPASRSAAVMPRTRRLTPVR